MRALEVLYEDYADRLTTDLNNLLVAAKANGAPKISTRDLVVSLQKTGYSVTPASIVTLLQNNPNITNASPEEISLTAAEGQPAANDQEDDSEDHVSDLAQQAIK